jgi:osmotically-inducible protein OsmY
MADRDTQSRYSRRPRNDRRDYDSPDYRQQEQFATGEDRGYGDESRSYSQMGESAYGRSDFRQSEPGYDTAWDSFERQPRDQRGYARRGPLGTGHYNYGPARFEGPGRSFDSFTGEDQEGRDFTAPKSRRAGGWQGGMPGTPRGYGYPGGTTRGDFYRDDDHDRGFFERAGDEIASWFGDDEAARRREMDHTGRGPKNYTRSDERILEDACDHLTEDWAVDARNIQVTVENGEISLDGTVATRDEKRHAEDCVEDISGVRHVQNNLRVQERSEWQSDRREQDITAEQPAAKT